MRLWAWDEICVAIIIKRWKKNFNGRPFFSLFSCCAGQSENPELGARPLEYCASHDGTESPVYAAFRCRSEAHTRGFFSAAHVKVDFGGGKGSNYNFQAG
jgi:hypothetical protein